MKEIWNQRYSEKQFIYGEEPNAYFAAILEPRYRAKLLLPGEGEGRNAFYAASIGWDVHAFDQSELGASKAMEYAFRNKVKYEYEINDCEQIDIAEEYYDAVGLIYLHLEPSLRQSFHEKIIKGLKNDGVIIAELFSVRQLPLNTGGPKNNDLLYTVEDIKRDFKDLKILELEEKMVDLSEGESHNGKAWVIRFYAKKIT